MQKSHIFHPVVPKVTFVDEWNNKVVLQAGKSKTYKLPYIGYPEPKITWTYNSTANLPETVITSADDKEITIMLKDVVRADTGIYELNVSYNIYYKVDKLSSP